MYALAAISASDPTSILGLMVVAISGMALYIQRISTDRVAREREISAEYREARDAAVKALADERTRRDDTVIATMTEIVKATAEVQTNITLMARHVLGGEAKRSRTAREDTS